jgi:HEAT repeat protein
MNNRYVFALVITMASAPAAAQPDERDPVRPAPVRTAPVGPGPMDMGPVGLGPVGPGPVGPGPSRVGPVGPGPMDMGPVGGPLGPGPVGFGRVKSAPIGFAPDQAPQVPVPVSPIDRIPTPLEILTQPDVVLPQLADLPRLIAPLPPAIDLSAVSEARLLVERMAYDFGQDRGRDREAELREREREREAQLYNEGYNAVAESRYDRAIGFFKRVIEIKGAKLDAAHYWMAYAQNRMGQRAEALATLAELAKNSPTSSYRKQANVLEAEVRREIGQPVRPQDSSDDEVKLMALQAMQHNAPEEAMPILEKLLEGTSSPKVKQRALFVLAQSKSPRAREVLRNYAKGSSTPELQSQAIQYLGVHGGPEHRALLAEVYGTTTDVDVKRRILRAFMVAGEKDRLFKAAQSETNPELRAEAVNQLGNMNAHEELWQLYQKESSIDVKRRIIRSMQQGNSIDRLVELAKSEQNPELRRDAVRSLGVMRSARTADVLTQIYATDSNVDVKKSVINALFVQENATALVALARKEQDTNLKKEIVGRLSNMPRNKIATDYMLELLGGK